MEQLLTLTDACQLTGLNKTKIIENQLIRRTKVNRKTMFNQEDLEKLREELEYRKKIRINHIPVKNKYIKIDRNKFVTAYDLFKITGLNPVTVHQLLEKDNIKFNYWNDAKFFNREESLNIVNIYLENKRNKKNGTRKIRNKQ